MSDDDDERERDEMPRNSEPHADDALLAAMQRLGRLMASRQVSTRIADAAGAEVSRQGVQLLRALHRDGQLPVAGLAASAHMDIAAVSRQLRPLEAAGLVERVTADHDGRVALVSLTAAGRRLADRIRSVGLRHLDAALASWSDADRRRLSTLLSRLVDDMMATEIAPEPDEAESLTS
jgi:DNA-binding MarR family transcriptional regulator